MLSDADRNTLLDLARRTVSAAAAGGELPALKDPGAPLGDLGAAFVTLRMGEDLRGCIGHIDAHLPLWQSVRDMAAAAAERDSRFTPVRPDEVPRLGIEISVLSPMTPIRPSEIRVGTHGLYVRHEGAGSGLLLPQVAVEWEWTAGEFLRRTFEKAGLPPDDPKATVHAFTVEKFGDGV